MMKKIFTVAAALLFTVGGLMAQNDFKGIVKYDVASTGEVAIDLPAEVRQAEIKVSGNDMFTKSPIFCNGLTEAVLVRNLTSTSCQNLGMYLNYFRGEGFEFTYQGSGKILVKQESKASDFDSVDIVDTEPGHFYYEYVQGETKTIAGRTAKKMIRHAYDDEGVDHPMVMWYSDEIGPKINILFGGIKGMPLECTIDAGEGRAITYTATEIVNGKVKDADFLLPDGYETLTEEEMETLGNELQDAMELMSEE
ncbi:MAG: hypothetical protein K6E96_09565 [Bacteroidales bacterium]|nr:hypothetical protein [Bacteroidales bacterium]